MDNAAFFDRAFAAFPLVAILRGVRPGEHDRAAGAPPGEERVEPVLASAATPSRTPTPWTSPSFWDEARAQTFLLLPLQLIRVVVVVLIDALGVVTIARPHPGSGLHEPALRPRRRACFGR